MNLNLNLPFCVYFEIWGFLFFCNLLFCCSIRRRLGGWSLRTGRIRRSQLNFYHFGTHVMNININQLINEPHLYSSTYPTRSHPLIIWEEPTLVISLVSSPFRNYVNKTHDKKLMVRTVPMVITVTHTKRHLFTTTYGHGSLNVWK